MGELPDVVLGFTQENWATLGMTPILLYRLVERGWTHDEIDEALKFAIGDDYTDIKATEIIDRLERGGVKFPDEIPVVEILDRIVFFLHGGGH